MQQPKLACQDSVRSSQTGSKFITVCKYIQTECKYIKLIIEKNVDKKFKTTYVTRIP